mmetsp:Transcript_48526/g.103269  ORF Transcript_48526/g.103269 Transcript_48526/m.103269 type:complete len:328 (+) Transcript_48526:761-1744(+)
MTSNPLFIIVALSNVIFAPMSQFGCVVAFFCTAMASFSHISNSSSFVRSLNAPPLAVSMILLSPPGGTPCRHWKMALCSESAGSILIPCFSTRGLMTGPPDMSVSLFARAMSFPSLIASMVGRRPAAPTMPVTTVSAEPTVAASTIPSAPWTISGMSAQPSSFSMALSSSAASGVARDATLGEYFITCSAISCALFPALRASTTKFSGQASTMSRVCVPMLPVEPRIEILFWNVDPFRLSASVFSREAAEFTGAEGSIHPAPVPSDPGVEKTLREVAARVGPPTAGAKEEASWARRRTLRAREGSFMVVLGFLLELEQKICVALTQV